jgi:hypothetical protein
MVHTVFARVQAYLTKAMELVADTLSSAAAVHAQPSFSSSQAGVSVGGASTPSSLRGSEVGESIKGLPSAPQHTIPQQVLRPSRYPIPSAQASWVHIAPEKPQVCSTKQNTGGHMTCALFLSLPSALPPKHIVTLLQSHAGHETSCSCLLQLLPVHKLRTNDAYIVQAGKAEPAGGVQTL